MRAALHTTKDRDDNYLLTRESKPNDPFSRRFILIYISLRDPRIAFGVFMPLSYIAIVQAVPTYLLYLYECPNAIAAELNQHQRGPHNQIEHTTKYFREKYNHNYATTIEWSSHPAA